MRLEIVWRYIRYDVWQYIRYDYIYCILNLNLRMAKELLFSFQVSRLKRELNITDSDFHSNDYFGSHLLGIRLYMLCCICCAQFYVHYREWYRNVFAFSSPFSFMLSLALDPILCHARDNCLLPFLLWLLFTPPTPILHSLHNAVLVDRGAAASCGVVNMGDKFMTIDGIERESETEREREREREREYVTMYLCACARVRSQV